MIEPSPKTKRLIERNRKRGISPTPEQEAQRLEEMEQEERERMEGWEGYKKRKEWKMNTVKIPIGKQTFILVDEEEIRALQTDFSISNWSAIVKIPILNWERIDAILSYFCTHILPYANEITKIIEEGGHKASRQP